MTTKTTDGAVSFFYEHAGYSYKPDEETREEGRLRGAIALAFAELQADIRGWTVEWVDDWSTGSHVTEYDGYDEEPMTCEGCILRDRNGDHIESLWCIDDATSEYRRVVAAELADQALYAKKIVAGSDE